MKKVIGIVYELKKNPFFDFDENHYNDRISEFVRPSEIDGLTKAFKSLGFDVMFIDGPEGLLEQAEVIKKKCRLIFNKSIGFKGLERKIHVPAICQLFQLPLVVPPLMP